MRVEVNNGEIGEVLCEGPHDWISDGVIAAEAHWFLSFI